jgi:hypothetical protein
MPRTLYVVVATFVLCPIGPGHARLKGTADEETSRVVSPRRPSFDEVWDLTSIEYPARDPSTGHLATLPDAVGEPSRPKR